MKTNKYEFDNTEHNFYKTNAKSEYNFYNSSNVFNPIILAIKDYDLKLTDKIIVHGTETDNKHFGKTIWVHSQEVDINSREYIVCVLSEIKRISHEKAIEIYETCNSNNLECISEYLQSNKIKGVGKKTIEEIIKKVDEVKKDDLFSKLHLLLDNVKYAKKISEQIKNLDMLYANPYAVLKKLRIGFKKIDEIARTKLNISLDNPNRIEYLIEYKFTQFNVKQSNYIELNDFKEYLINEVKYLSSDIDTFLEKNKLLKVENEKVYLINIYEAETRTPELLHNDFTISHLNEADIRESINSFELRNYMKLSDNQKESIISIVKSDKLSILTGEAGTGKSTITKCICDIVCRENKLLLLSPTGKASRRMYECTGRDAYTIHSFVYFLQSDYANSYLTYQRFGIDEGFVLIIDESSMIDQLLFYQLLKCIDDSSWLNLEGIILIGDPYQLPSVGCGQVLLDLIESKCFNHVHLTETFRQLADSNIIKNSKKVRNRKCVDNIKVFDFWVDKLNKDNIKKFFYHFVNKYNNSLLEIYKNVQFVTSTNKTKDNINDCFKKNVENKCKFGIGDKVINIRNNKENGINNGDFGIVESIDKKRAVIYFYDIGKRIQFEKNELSNIVLGYACTTHKLQGSEYKTVVIVLENNMAIADFRSLYTAITRGKENVIILTNSISDLNEVCTRSVDRFRKTNFIKKLKKEFK